MDDEDYLSGDEQDRGSDGEEEEGIGGGEKSLRKRRGGGDNDAEMEGEEEEEEEEEEDEVTGQKKVKYAYDEEGRVVEDMIGAPRPDETFLKKYIKYGYDLDLELEEDQTFLQWNSWYFQNGDVYEGLTFDDQFHGRGVLETATSGTYSGEFYHNKASGHGVLHRRLDLVTKAEDEKTAPSTTAAAGAGSRETGVGEGTTTPEGDDLDAVMEIQEEPIIPADVEEFYAPPEPDPVLDLYNRQTLGILGVTDQKVEYIKELEQAIQFVKDRRLEKRIDVEVPDEEVEEDVKRMKAERREALEPEYNPFRVDYSEEELRRGYEPPDEEDKQYIEMARAAVNETRKMQEVDDYDSDDEIDKDGWAIERSEEESAATESAKDEGVKMATDAEWADYVDIEKDFKETRELLEAPDEREVDADPEKDLEDEADRLEQELEALNVSKTEKRMVKDHLRKWNRYHGAVVWSGQFENGRPHGCGVLSIGGLDFAGKMDREVFVRGSMNNSEPMADCPYDVALWHAGLGEVSSLKAQMFKFKPQGMVQVKERPILMTHPYMYDEGDEWMAPGFTNEYFPVPKYLQKTVKKMDAERELWLGSFIRAPLRLPGPAEIEHQYKKLMFEQPVAFVDEETGDEYMYDPQFKRLITFDKDANGDIKNMRAMIVDEAQAAREGKELGIWEDVPTGLEDVLNMKIPDAPPTTNPFEAVDWALDEKQKELLEEYEKAVAAVKEEREKTKEEVKSEVEQNKLEAEEKLKATREKAAKAKERAVERLAEKLESLFKRGGRGEGGDGGDGGEEEEEEEEDEEEDEEEEEERGGGGKSGSAGSVRMSGRSDGVLNDDRTPRNEDKEEESGGGEYDSDDDGEDGGGKQKKRVTGRISETVAMAVTEGAAASSTSQTVSPRSPTAFASISMGAALTLQNSAAFVTLVSRSQRVVQQVFDRASRSVSRFASIPRLSRQGTKLASAIPRPGRAAIASMARVAVAKWRLQVARESPRLQKHSLSHRGGGVIRTTSQRCGYARVGGPVGDFADEHSGKNDQHSMGPVAAVMAVTASAGNGRELPAADVPLGTTKMTPQTRRRVHTLHDSRNPDGGTRCRQAAHENTQNDDLSFLCLALPIC